MSCTLLISQTISSPQISTLVRRTGRLFKPRRQQQQQQPLQQHNRLQPQQRPQALQQLLRLQPVQPQPALLQRAPPPQGVLSSILDKG